MENNFPLLPIKYNDIDKIKEYNNYESIFLLYEFFTFDELILIRDRTKIKRAKWMNNIDFLNYENKYILYISECNKIEKEWKIYDDNKLKGTKKCPFCNILLNNISLS
jgi:hypothetical protein